MGGRGASSATAKARGASSVASAKSHDEVRQYMASKYGVTVGSSLDKLPLDSVKLAVSGVEDVVKEFPAIGPDITIRYVPLGSNTYAQATLSGEVRVGGRFVDVSSLESTYANDLRSRFHPDGSTARNITSHEVGHIIEAHLVNAENSTFYAQVDHWNKHKHATDIVGRAARQVKKTPAGKGRKIADLVADVSRYATTNRSEALAECIADYTANGSRAKPLSQAVWGILKSELR